MIYQCDDKERRKNTSEENRKNDEVEKKKTQPKNYNKRREKQEKGRNYMIPQCNKERKKTHQKRTEKR